MSRSAAAPIRLPFPTSWRFAFLIVVPDAYAPLNRSRPRSRLAPSDSVPFRDSATVCAPDVTWCRSLPGTYPPARIESWACAIEGETPRATSAAAVNTTRDPFIYDVLRRTRAPERRADVEEIPPTLDGCSVTLVTFAARICASPALPRRASQ